MNTSTILLILLSVLIASGFSYFQYLFKAKSLSATTKLLAFLRFITVFGILLLLINPVITRSTFETIKTPLPIVVDNSASITDLKADANTKEVYNKLVSNSNLKEKFDVQSYGFDSEFKSSEIFDFKGKQTKIDLVASNLNSIYKNRIFPIVLITDGNQTSGTDYVFSFNQNNKVYPIVVGDTTTYLDLKINTINVNKYAFHKNKFPAEVFLQYTGSKSVSAKFTISQGNETFVSQSISFSPNKKSEVVNVLLPANKTGVQIYNAKIASSETEKNSFNNTKKFAVEVIDQRSEVALISSINHPDLGAIIRAIETNAQRKVTIIKPNQNNSLGNYNVLILYQPTAEFKSIFDSNKNLKINTFIITGNKTNFNFLNQYQSDFEFKMSSQKEDYLASFNSNFNLFALDNIGFDSFPPLENPFGTITAKPNVTTLLSSSIRNVPTNAPLLAFSETSGKRCAYLFGENIWKWRADSYVNKKSFNEFDVFLDKTMQFLVSNDSRKTLVVNHERFYNLVDAIEISAQYFNKNYELDEKARLTIAVTNSKTKQIKKFDLLKSNSNFKVNLDGLTPGNYTFQVKELNSNSSYSSSFEIFDFNIEKQFVNPDLPKLKQLASHTNGLTYVPNQVEQLIKNLLENPNYKMLEKTSIQKTPLIDWYWLLLLIVLSLSVEWFVRKYNGLL